MVNTCKLMCWSFVSSDIKASKETVPPPSLISSKLCTSATHSVRSWASNPCSPKLRNLHQLQNPNPNPLLHPRRKHSGQQWRASHNRRTSLDYGFIDFQMVKVFGDLLHSRLTSSCRFLASESEICPKFWVNRVRDWHIWPWRERLLHNLRLLFHKSVFPSSHVEHSR